MKCSTRWFTFSMRSLHALAMLSVIAFFSVLPAHAQIGELPPASETTQRSDQSIALESDAQSDQAIATRLREIYDNIDALVDVQVAVDSGVVTLQGDILTKAARLEALEIAKAVEGVVGVNDQLQRVYAMDERLNYTFVRLTDRFYALLAALPLLAVAIGVFGAFWLMSRLLLQWDSLFEKLTPNAFIVDLLKQLARGILLITGLLIALEIMDATAMLGAIFGAAGLLGLAVGFAIRDTVENYIASILLSLRQPFAPNDHIVIGEFEGLVVRLNSRATILLTFDGNHIRIPNSIVYKGIITNYSRNPERRFSFEVGIDTEVDLTAARALAIETLTKTPGVLEQPAPICQIQRLGDSTVVLTVFGWTDQGRYDFGKVRSTAIQAIKEAFDAADVAMPEPIYRLRVEGLAAQSLPLDDKATRDMQPAPEIRAHISAEQADKALSVSKDTSLDRKIAEEAATGVDLLREEAPQE